MEPNASTATVAGKGDVQDAHVAAARSTVSTAVARLRASMGRVRCPLKRFCGSMTGAALDLVPSVHLLGESFASRRRLTTRPFLTLLLKTEIVHSTVFFSTNAQQLRARVRLWDDERHADGLRTSDAGCELVSQLIPGTPRPRTVSRTTPVAVAAGGSRNPASQGVAPARWRQASRWRQPSFRSACSRRSRVGATRRQWMRC